MRHKTQVLALLFVFPLFSFATDKKTAATRPTKKVAAKSPKEYAEFPRLLTARELLAMGPVKRQEYFENLRGMLNELDKMSFLKLGRLVAAAEKPHSGFVARYPAFFELFEYAVPKAHAATCLDPRYPFAVGSLCGSLCASRPIGNDETGRAVENVYFCFPRNQYEDWSRANGGNGRLELPEDLRSLNSGSWSEREPRIIAAQREKAQQVMDDRRAALEKELADKADRERAEPGTTMNRLLQEARAQEILDNLDREELHTGTILKEMAEEAERQKRIAEEQAKAAAPPKIEDEPLAETRPTAGKTPTKGLADGKCSPAKLSCTDRDAYLKKAHKDALKTFRASQPVNCVSAGNMSQYAGNDVKAGNCGIVRDFCIRKDDCAKPAADSEGGFKTRYSCPAGQAICSPFIYGLETKQKAICVAQKGKHLTEACDDKAKALKGKEGYVGDFLAQAPAGVAEAWDEYANAFNGTCKQKTESQDAHCLECGIIGRRLQDARALASGSCTDALGYKQMRPGHGTPETTK